jgi:hypothetical protein
MFSLCNDDAKSASIGQAMSDAFKSAGITSDIFISSLNGEGAKVINR